MRSRPLIIATITTASVSLSMAGCGGGSSPTASTSGYAGLVAYAGCMRSHGVPTFPDPTSRQGIPKDKIPIAAPRFTTASNACQHLMPPGGLGPQPTPQHTQTRVAAGIAFARCFRAHGFPNFPDPVAGGQITHQMLANAGINLHQPAVVQAADACASVTHGLITKASVASFVAGH